MATRKLMTMTFTQSGDEVTVSTEFAETLPVARIFEMARMGIKGFYETAESIGRARGMSAEEIDTAVFGGEGE